MPIHIPTSHRVETTVSAQRWRSLGLMLLTASMVACLGTDRDAPPPQTAQAVLHAMVVVPGLEEPLVATKPTSAEEDRAMQQAVARFRAQVASPSDEDLAYLAPFERFVAAYPDSGWSTAVLTDLGLGYYHTGYFSRAFDAWTKAWQLGKPATEPHAKALVDRAVGELARMHARVGHADELDALFKEIGKRPLVGPATEAITGAHEGAWEMRNNPGDAYLCGPKALGNTLRALGASPEAAAFTDKVRSGRHGFTLNQVARLADAGGMPYRLIHREAGQAIPVPSVINWKVHHYAAIVSEEDGHYHVQDPTFGGDLLVSRAAIDAEGSGYFLVPRGGAEDSAWREATIEEADGVYGMGFTSTSDPGAVKPNDKKIHEGCGTAGFGMCVPNAHAMNVSLNLNDTPIGYAPQKGPPVFIQLTYNQRDADQPANFGYFNLSLKWTMNFLSYVTEANITQTGTGVTRYVGGGGSVTYAGYSTSSGAFAPEKQTGTVLSRLPLTGVATSYTVTNSDGSRLVYSQSDGATSGLRRMFLTQVIDPQNNSLTLGYSIYPYSYPAPELRLDSITDAEGRTTTFSYGIPGSPLAVTGIQDPWGRTAQLVYGYPMLESITDVIGMRSSLTYWPTGSCYPCTTTDKMGALTTPYGIHVFNIAWDDAKNWRMLELIDPMGSTERVEFMHSAPGIRSSDSLVPQTVTTNNSYLNFRNSFYWDKNVYPTYGTETQKDYTKAQGWHWLHTAAGQTSAVPESVKEPLESRVWYNYPNQTTDSMHEGSLGMPTATARVLDNGSTQLSTATYNAIGKPLSVTDALGRVTKYTYAANNVDLLLVQQQISSAPTYATLASYTYNSQHEPLTRTDAAGKVWRYTYNAAGQLATETDPLNHLKTYNYDSSGRLTSIVNANNATAVTFSYTPASNLGACGTSPNYLNCDLPQSVTDSEGRTVSYQRDLLDRVTVVTYPDGTTDRYTYTKLDRTAYTDRLGRTTAYAYDLNRRLTSVTDPSGHVVSYAYFPNGTLKSITDQNGNVTTWTVDIQSRPTTKTFADGKTISYTYENSTSRLKSVTDALGQVKTLGYNTDDTLATINYTGAINPTPNVAFTYDPLFLRRTGMTDGIGTTSWSYVPIGTQGALSVLTEDGGFTNDAVTRGYDELGRMKTQTVGSTAAETWTYDAIGRTSGRTSMRDAYGGAYDSILYQYLGQTDAMTSRRVRSFRTSLGSISTRTFDTNTNDRRLIGTWANHRTVTIGYQAWDSAGQDPYHVTNTTGPTVSSSSETLCYQYDAADRLRSLSTPTAAGTDCAHPRTVRDTYEADAAGNLTTFIPASVPSSTQFTATYNNLNQLTTRNGQPLGHDSVGNMTSNGAYAFKWDAENRVVEIDTSATVTRYRYDGLGRRAEITYTDNSTSTPTTTTTRFVWCGKMLCAKLNASNAITARYFEEGQQNFDAAGNPMEPWVTSTDQVGSVTEVTNDYFGSLASFAYTPYGQLKASSGTAAPDFMYAGLYLDRNLGLYYSNTRIYDPTIGRWISRDPIAEAGGINLYEYVGGDPIDRRDPDGTFWVQAVGGVFGAGSQAWANYNAYHCGRISGTDYATSIGVGFATGVLATLPTGILAGALAGAAGSAYNEGYNVGIGAKKASDRDLVNAVVSGGFAGGFANGVARMGGQFLRPEGVIGGSLPLPPRQSYGELGGAVGTAVGTTVGTLASDD